MDLTPALIAAFATLFAGAVAATASLVVSVLSKEQKTSEMRQQWIDALRDDVAEAMAELSLLKALGEYADRSSPELQIEYLEKRHANLVRAAMLLARIDLRLDPVEHKHFIALIEQAAKRVSDRNKGPLGEEEANAALREIGNECVRVLQREWVRVKRGEPAFVAVKCIAFAIVSLAVLATAGLAYRAW